MKLALILILAVASVSGCGWFDRYVTANVTGYSIICVKETDVKYVQGPSGLAVLVDKRNMPVPCN